MQLKIGIVGGAGYTAGELIRLLKHHIAVKIAWIHSESNAAKPIDSVHRDLLGETDLCFTDKIDFKIDVLFLCVEHGKSAPFLEQYDFKNTATKIIVVSNDFRLEKQAEGFVYGLPELNKIEIIKAKYLANPGCFATAIQLALLPLAAHNLLQKELHIHGLIGTTGAGQRPRFSTHFSWVDNNVSTFKAFEHEHLDEIKQALSSLQKDNLPAINFIPIRGNFSRGIFITVYTDFEGSLEEASLLYQNYYNEQPFVHLSKQRIDLKQVINTNKCILELKVYQGKLLITAILDNLIKGAAGQAIQNMNLMCGLAEKTGLNLKGSAF